MLRGPAEPYVTLGYTAEFPADVDVTNLDGTDGGTITVVGSSAVDALVGSELIVHHDEDKHHRVAFDLSIGVGYRSPSERASGFWLPSVLPASQGIAVTRGEHFLVRGGVFLDVHITKWVGFRAGAEGMWLSPHTIEHLYPARTDPQRLGHSLVGGPHRPHPSQGRSAVASRSRSSRRWYASRFFTPQRVASAAAMSLSEAPSSTPTATAAFVASPGPTTSTHSPLRVRSTRAVASSPRGRRRISS